MDKINLTRYQLRELHSIWYSIRYRCGSDHPNYGGRGISMSPAWLYDFWAFARYLGPRPSRIHSVDRINVNGNYEPGNVRWATLKEQAVNKRNSRRKPVA